MDKEGNHYKYWVPPMETTNYSTFQSYTGDNTYRLFRYRKPNKNGTIFTKLEMSRADVVDWDDFYMPFTHAIDGFFYHYGNEVSYRPNNETWLTVNSIDNTEVCSIGGVMQDKNQIFYPEDEKKRNECLNHPTE